MASQSNNRSPTPFLINLYHQTGSFPRPQDLPHLTTPHTPLYAFKKTSLLQLVHLLADADPSVLPSPAIGTRVAFRLSFSDGRLLTTHYLGSVVIRGRNRDVGDVGLDDDDEEEKDDSEKTLHDVKFVVGDYLSCAILPPDEKTGKVAASVGYVPVVGGGEEEEEDVGGRRGSGGSRGGRDVADGRRREEMAGGRGGGFRGRGWGFGFGGGRGGPPMGGGYRGRGGFGGSGGGFPSGEWRRGENLPDEPLRGGFVERGGR